MRVLEETIKVTSSGFSKLFSLILNVNEWSMAVNWGTHSVVLTLAAFQAVIISILLLVRSSSKGYQSDRVLAFFLLSLTAVLAEHIAGWLNLYIGQGLTYFPFGETFVFAPFAYLYIKSITNSQYKLSKKDGFHFIPAGIYFLVHLFVWFHPLEQKQQLIDTLFRYKWQTLQGYGSALIFTIYLYKIVRYYKAYLKWLPEEFSNIEKLKLNWIRNFIVLLGLYYLVFIGFGIAGLVNWYGYKTQFWMYLILAITIYYLSVSGYAYVHKLTVAFDMNKTMHGQEAGFDNSKPLPAGETELSEQTALLKQDLDVMDDIKPVAVAELDGITHDLFIKYNFSGIKELLLHHLESEKPYLDSDLSLTQLANQLEKPAYIISQVIKHGMGMNFNDLINGYRVDAVIEKIKKGEYKTQTLLGIAFDCGFNSKATFNRAFKKAQNIAPSEFIEKL